MRQPLPAQVVDVIEAAASHAEGVAPLFDGQLEAAASLYQLHPSQVEEARRFRSSPEVGEIVSRAAPRAAARFERAAPRSVDAVIADAKSRPDGLDLLEKAPLETAAVLFGAHAFVIDDARARLAASERGS